MRRVASRRATSPPLAKGRPEGSRGRLASRPAGSATRPWHLDRRQVMVTALPPWPAMAPWRSASSACFAYSARLAVRLHPTPDPTTTSRRIQNPQSTIQNPESAIAMFRSRAHERLTGCDLLGRCHGQRNPRPNGARNHAKGTQLFAWRARPSQENHATETLHPDVWAGAASPSLAQRTRSDGPTD